MTARSVYVGSRDAEIRYLILLALASDAAKAARRAA